MSNIGHNNPPLDPKETIQNNINRKKPILDREPQIFKGVPIPSWIELSLIDVCIDLVVFAQNQTSLLHQTLIKK